MAKKAEVMLGTYMADVELTAHGSIVLTITGADISEKLFEHFLKSGPVLKVIEFDPEPRVKLGEARCFP